MAKPKARKPFLLDLGEGLISESLKLGKELGQNIAKEAGIDIDYGRNSRRCTCRKHCR